MGYSILKVDKNYVRVFLNFPLNENRHILNEITFPLNKQKTDNQQETPSKKRHILKRVISSSQGNGYDRNDGKLDKAGKSSSREKKMTLRTVRNLMKLGKQRPRSQSRDSSTEDEGR